MGETDSEMASLGWKSIEMGEGFSYLTTLGFGGFDSNFFLLVLPVYEWLLLRLALSFISIELLFPF